jgi:DNA-binding transcriptional LysR family regulator
MDITLDQARAFCAFVDHHGYQAAGDALHKSHSAVVYSINCLEKQCGFDLLDRSSYRNSLTTNGQRIYEKCSQLLAVAGELQDLCRDLSGDFEATVKIVYDGVLPTDPFLSILKLVEGRKIPSRVQIFADFLDGVERTFVNKDANLMVSVVAPKETNFTSHALPAMRSVLVAHRDHPINLRKNAWKARELKDFHFLSVRGADHNLPLGTKEFEESTAVHLSDFSLKKEAILKKMGFGWLPERMILSELKSRKLKIIKWERSSVQHLHPFIYHRKDVPLGQTSRLILQELIKGHHA